MKPIVEFTDILINAKRYDIMNEASFDKKEAEIVIKQLNENYTDKIVSAYRSIISKYKDLSKCKYNNTDNSFRYKNNIIEEDICLILDYFENYASERGLSNEEAKEAYSKFKKDIYAFKAQISAVLKPLKMKVLFIDADYGADMSEFFKVFERYMSNGTIIDNTICCYVVPDDTILEKLRPSKSDIKENDKRKYLMLYDEFAKFIKNPHRLNGQFRSIHLADICRIIGMSSTKLNDLVAKNIKSLPEKSFDKEYQYDFSKRLSKTIGEKYYIIDDLGGGSGDYVIYSIKNKKLYWICYEHEDVEIFYNNFPYSSRELEDIIYFDEKKLNSLRNLFKEYDAAKKYNLFE